VQVEGLGQGDIEVSEAVQVVSQALEESIVGGVDLKVKTIEVEAIESRFGIQKLKLKQLLIQYTRTQPELQYILLQSGLLIVLKVQ
jgi:hypothetical protein